MSTRQISSMSEWAVTFLAVIAGLLLLCGPVSAERAADTAISFDQARELFTKGDLPEAVLLLEQFIEHSPKHREARDLLFSCYRLLGIELYGQAEYDRALAVWQRAIDLKPENEEILGYIERCRAERDGLKKMSGEAEQPGASIDIGRHDLQKSSMKRDLVSEEDHSDLSKTRKTAAGVVPSKQMIRSGIAYGLAFGTGVTAGPELGRFFTGHFSFFPNGTPIGIRLAGSYTNFHAATDGQLNTPERITVLGGSLATVVNLTATRDFSLYGALGAGLYEVYRAEPRLILSTELSDSETAAALTASFGLQSSIIGLCDATFDVEYVRLSGDLSPDLLRFAVGFAVY